MTSSAPEALLGRSLCLVLRDHECGHRRPKAILSDHDQETLGRAFETGTPEFYKPTMVSGPSSEAWTHTKTGAKMHLDHRTLGPMMSMFLGQLRGQGHAH